jgi:uncharacterized paraquat-inducible protein A
MSPIRCPKCGSEITGNAKACPKCSATVMENIDRELKANLAYVVAWIIVAIISGIVLFLTVRHYMVPVLPPQEQ